MRIRQLTTPIPEDYSGYTTRILDVPNVRQWIDCGAAAMTAVLGFYGIPETEREVMALADTDEHWGTEPEDMARVMASFGLEPSESSGMTVEDLRAFTQSRWPVIVAIQAWADREDYGDDWEDSHYVVVKGVDDRTVWFEDPSTYSDAQLPIEEFEERWHGWDEDHVRWGMVIRPGRRRPDPIQRWAERPT